MLGTAHRARRFLGFGVPAADWHLVKLAAAEADEQEPWPDPGRFAHRVPVRLRWALLLVVAYHGSLLLSGSYEGTYDAYVHMFLGDHYARDWFSTWEQRWYTGFTTVSYPPGTHMAMGAISKLTGSLASAFIIVQTAMLLLLTIGVYRFSRIWVDERAAANASVLVVFSSAIAETVHVFGQLPTIFALAFLLNALPYLRGWVFGGRLRDLGTGIVVLAACTAGHHVTTLFGSVFFFGPVVVAGLLEQSRIPRTDETVVGDLAITRSSARELVERRVRRVLPAVGRLVVLAPMVLGALVIVVLPYWLWSSSDPINQVAIPHGSRANFLEDLNLGLVFFAIPWGLMFFLIPYAIVRAVSDRMWPLAASIALLFVLGTGGTTPIPRLLLGPAFDILTLDRFTFWACIMILPMAGLFVSSLENGAIAEWIRHTGGPVMLRATHSFCTIALVLVSLFSANLSAFRPFQPDRIDTDPIVAFLEKDQHEQWRFMTLGFGDQMAALSAATTATQVDGNYHSARRLPELTSTSVERLEGAKYRGISGLGSLQQFLEVPEKYNLKFIFSNDQFYDPLLQVLGWQNLGPLENGIVVWEKADIEPLPAVLPVREVPNWQRVMWGTVPPSMIIIALIALAVRLFFVKPNTLQLDDPTRERKTGPIVVLVRKGLSAIPSPSRKRKRQIAVLCAGILLIGGAATLQSEPMTPQETVEAYYDHLDFRRWTEAYDLLDPDTKPPFELWRLQFSVRGGLLSSFAKLDDMSTALTDEDDFRATVSANLRYLTSIEWYDVDREHGLVERDGRWFINAEEPELTVPPDQLVRRPSIAYAIQGRRRVTQLSTEQTDVQDRPEIDVHDVQVVDHDGLPVVVGMVSNRDVDPADLTLTAVLRNEDGDQIARYNATDHLIRTLNPRESTPFRIDFQRVAAGNNITFDPHEVNPIELTEEIAYVEVYGKAVVTTQGLYRSLGVNAFEAEPIDGGGITISGELRNDGAIEVIIPVLIVSYLDDDGDVLWVERRFVEQSIRAQRSLPFEFTLEGASEVTPSDLEVKVFSNSVGEELTAITRSVGLIEAPAGSGATSIRLDILSVVGAELIE